MVIYRRIWVYYNDEKFGLLKAKWPATVLSGITNVLLIPLTH